MNDDRSIEMQRRKKKKGSNTLPFKEILKALMSERKLTSRKIAELAGVNPTVVQNWLEGKNPHDLQAVSKLAQGLKVSFKSLLLGESEYVEGPTSVAELFEEQEWFDGLAKITIKRLIPRKREP